MPTGYRNTLREDREHPEREKALQCQEHTSSVAAQAQTLCLKTLAITGFCVLLILPYLSNLTQ